MIKYLLLAVTNIVILWYTNSILCHNFTYTPAEFLCIKKSVTETNIAVTVQLFREINILDISGDKKKSNHQTNL